MSDYLVIGQAEIDEMRKRIAADRWIPVGERLPEFHFVQLVWDAANGDLRFGSLQRPNKKHHDAWWDVIDGWSNSRVTHWRPLPEPPPMPQEEA